MSCEIQNVWIIHISLVYHTYIKGICKERKNICENIDVFYECVINVFYKLFSDGTQ